MEIRQYDAQLFRFLAPFVAGNQIENDAGESSGSVTAIVNAKGTSLVDATTAVDMNANRNFSSGDTLDVTFYTGVSGDTFTNGTDIAQFYVTANSRLYASINWQLAKGNTVGVQYTPPVSTGNDVYVALICHLKDANE